MALDMISYGEANKASRMLKSTQAKMGADVKYYYDNSKEFEHVQERVDALTEKVIAHYKLTDDLAIQNSLNMIKANQKMNLTEQLIRLSGDSMVFDDLVDLSGIDADLSSQYTHTVSSHWITSTHNDCVVTTIPERVDMTRRNLLFIVDADSGVESFVTHQKVQDGVAVIWRKLEASEGRFIFKLSDITSDEIRFQFKIPNGKRLYYYGWVMA